MNIKTLKERISFLASTDRKDETLDHLKALAAVQEIPELLTKAGIYNAKTDFLDVDRAALVMRLSEALEPLRIAKYLNNLMVAAETEYTVKTTSPAQLLKLVEKVLRQAITEFKTMFDSPEGNSEAFWTVLKDEAKPYVNQMDAMIKSRFIKALEEEAKDELKKQLKIGGIRILKFSATMTDEEITAAVNTAKSLGGFTAAHYADLGVWTAQVVNTVRTKIQAKFASDFSTQITGVKGVGVEEVKKSLETLESRTIWKNLVHGEALTNPTTWISAFTYVFLQELDKTASTEMIKDQPYWLEVISGILTKYAEENSPTTSAVKVASEETFTDYAQWKAAVLARGLKIWSDTTADPENGPDPDEAFEPTWAIENKDTVQEAKALGAWNPEDNIGVLCNTTLEMLYWMNGPGWDPYENDPTHGKNQNE